MKLSYPAVFYPWDDGRGFTVEVPDLAGCVSEGESLAEAILMGTEAAAGWLLTWMEKGGKLPEPSRADAIKPDEPGGIVNILAVDLEAHLKKYPRKTVKETIELEIPIYLSEFAKARHLDISQLAVSALSEEFQHQAHLELPIQ